MPEFDQAAQSGNSPKIIARCSASLTAMTRSAAARSGKVSCRGYRSPFIGIPRRVRPSTAKREIGPMLPALPTRSPLELARQGKADFTANQLKRSSAKRLR